MKRFATMEAMMQRRPQERQFDLLMPAVDDLAPPLFDLAARAEIVSLLKALLNGRLAPVRMPEADDD
jgi:hypothetical protein